MDARFLQLRVKHLALLDLIHRHGSLRRAATELHLTQPAVSAMLKELEASFDATLVERNRQGAQLTPYGRAIRERLNVVLNELQAARQAHNISFSAHHLRVGVLPIAMLDLLPGAVARLRNAGYDLSLKITEGTVEDVTVSLLNNDVDCIIGRIDSASLSSVTMQTLSVELLQKMPLQVACSLHHPLRQNRSISLDEFILRNWVLPSCGSQTRTAFDQAFIQTGCIPPLPAVESVSFFSNFRIVAQSDLLTLAPRRAVARYQELDVIYGLAFDWPVPLSPLLFICSKEKTEVDAIMRLRHALTETAQAVTCLEGL